MSGAWAWLTLVVGLGSLVAFGSLRRGDLVSPFTVVVALLLSIFAVRPLLIKDDSSMSLYGLDFRPGFETASLVGLVATTAFVTGYAVQRSRRSATPPHPPKTGPPSAPAQAGVATAWFWRCLVAGDLVLGLWVVTTVATSGPGAFAALANGRTTALVGASTLPVIVPALPAAAAVVLAFGRVTTERAGRLTWVARATYWCSIFLCALPSAFSGSRRFLLPVVLVGLLGAWGVGLRKAVSVWALAAFVAVFAFVSAVPYVRSTGSRASGASLGESVVAYLQDNGVSGVLRNLFVSYDTQMFDYIALISARIGSSLEFGLGRGTVGEALLVPLPRRLAPVPTWSDQLLTSTYGGACGTGDACPVPSVPGTLYFDLGYVGVAVGMFLLGRLALTLQVSLPQVSGLRLAAVLVAISSTPSVFRGNPVSQVWISANILLVCGITLAVVSRSTSRPPSQAPRPASVPAQARVP
ncbi:hypothetical protein GCM10027047_34320 [Rhodococcus aerolatus]